MTTMAQRIAMTEYAVGRTTDEVRRWANDKYKFNPPLPSSAVYKITVTNKDKHVVACEAHLSRKRRVSQATYQHDTKVIEWVREQEKRKVSVSGEILRDAAFVAAEKLGIPFEERAEYSKGWLYRFQVRTKLNYRRYYGEASSVSQAQIDDGRAAMQLICREFAPVDIFNMDETAFYYRMSPNGTISMELSPGVKRDKSRVTLCVGTNSTGSEKPPLLCIGKSKEPVCFRGHNVQAEFGVDYAASKKGWMNSDVFATWLQDLNTRMAEADRKILMLVDNVSSHKQTELSNIRLEMLPKNTTSVLQPMDQGIIHSLKAKVKSWKQVSAIVKAYNGDKNPYKHDLLSALEWCGKAWEDVSSATVANCWRKAGILNADQVTTPPDDLGIKFSPFKEELLEQLRQTF